jgi:glycosyltransferase involved in cell wall biosynthesis
MIKVLYLYSGKGFGGLITNLTLTLKHLDRSKFKPIVAGIIPPDEKQAIVSSEFHHLGDRGLFKLLELVRQTGPDLISSHGYKADCYLGALKLLGLISCPIIATAHGWGIPTDWKLRAYYLLDKAVMTLLFDKVILVSEGQRTALPLIRAEKLQLIRNAPPTVTDAPSRDDARRLLGVTDSDTVFGYVGRLSSEKNVLQLIEELRSVDNATLVAVGEGPEKEALVKAAKDARLNLVLPGYLTDLQRIYPAFDYYISTSRAEGMPNSVLEAQAHGISCALSDIPAHRELAEQGYKIATFMPGRLKNALAELSTVSESIPAPRTQTERIRELEQLYRDTLKKRLLIITHSLGVGGAERIILSLLPELEKRYDVALCTLDEESQTPQVKSYFAEREPGLAPGNFLRIAQIIRRFRPHLIHAHQYTPWFYGVFGRLLSLSRARVIFTEHGRHYPDRVSPIRRAVNCILLVFTQKITAVSEATRLALVENEGISAERIQVIRNGFIPSVHKRKDLRELLGVSRDEKLIGFVGNLREVKNPALLLQAFKALNLPDATLVFIGDGPLRSELEKLAAGAKVKFTGSLVPASAWIHDLNLFVLPSWSEGTSLALLEALSARVPVIATAVGGSVEVLNNGEFGRLVPPGDVVAMSEAIREGLSDNAHPNASEFIRSRYSMEEMARGYLEVLGG